MNECFVHFGNDDVKVSTVQVSVSLLIWVHGVKKKTPFQ